MFTLTVSVALIFSIFPSIDALLYLSPALLPTHNYDFIIVGAGTAGNVVANRLSEDSSKRILVIEAGVDDTGVIPVQVPFLAPLTQETFVDWNYTTIAQPGLNNRSITVPRGFVLGGSSSINFMVWTRGSSEIWDHYAEVIGDDGWNWESMKPFWNKISTLVPPTANPSAPAPPVDDPNLSNGDGPITVNLPNWPSQLDGRTVDASKLLQEGEDKRWKFTEDMNTGDSIGFGINQENAGHGSRSSSATAYLHPALNTRLNLDVLILSRVTRLLQDTSVTSGDPVFNSVEVAQTEHGPRFKLFASSEIVLSAGSIGTPQILLLSGIGPRDELEEKGINVLVDSPGERTFYDHPLLPVYFSVNSDTTFDEVLRDPLKIADVLAKWTFSRTGLLASSPTNVIGFLRLPDTLLEGETDPASGPNTPHIELVFLDGFAPLGVVPQPTSGNYLTLLTAVVSPKSFGQVTLESANGATFTKPLIDYQLFKDDFDIKAMLQALKDAETFLSTDPWTGDGFLIGPFGSYANATTDEEKIQYIRNNAMTVYHPIGTARMGKDESSVTDPRLLVRGVKGVRVVDASVFPNLPECHPTAPILTLAERAAALIKEDNAM
ncbi:hypothetical protein VKT23_016511 [Stygiomarasmius scandens]|uniref:Glucose-methanol-choline oxidoreductase N-terminal domain-containing protein n=1 Tax=Marasmiellus scandens TaxID=2682957 RepID=A0ABR1IW41_9AGAR